jgi:probable F420-dependent oxidoreductase
MRLGFALPQVGPVAGPDSIIAVAQRAEELGFDSLWVLDRILFPVNPRSPYPVGDGSLPDPYRRTLDPLETLTFAAAHTRTLALGTSILNLPWYNPVLLARQLSTVDVLSNGRLRVGFGVGWSPDEYDAVAIPMQERGKRADELLRALKAVWTTDPVEFHGKYYHIPESFIGPKPVQKPYPPIYMAAYTASAMKRAAREADGWFPVGIPISAIAQMFDTIKGMAQSAGRDPTRLELIVRANVEFSIAKSATGRADFTGTLDQIAEDVAAVQSLGAAELLFDVQFSPGVDTVGDILDKMEQLWRVAEP